TLRDALAELGLDGPLAPATAIVLLPSGSLHAVAAPQVASRAGRVGAEARVAERVGPGGARDEDSPVGQSAGSNGGHAGADRQDDEPGVQLCACARLRDDSAR